MKDKKTTITGIVTFAVSLIPDSLVPSEIKNIVITGLIALLGVFASDSK